MWLLSYVSPNGYGNVSYNDFFYLKNQRGGVLIFCRTPTLTPGFENLGFRTQTPTPALKNLDSDTGSKIRV